MSNKEATFLPLQQRVVVLIKKLDGLWFLLNITGLTFSLIYTLLPILFDKDKLLLIYKSIFLISLLSDSLIFLKYFGLKGFKFGFKPLLSLLNWEPFCYLVYSAIFLNLSFTYGSTLPISIRYLKNSINFIRKDILILIEPAIQKELIRYKLNPDQKLDIKLSNIYLKLQSIILTLTPILLKLNILIELFLLPLSVLFSSLLSFKLLPILFYGLFLKLRISNCKAFKSLLFNLLAINFPMLKSLVQ
ncbi:hypothetical protein K502DRAFT_365851 [Neoconidiobolus thromboides FSU 785]|nr:hypothetical protein K502DRAFT_365851 [Neoconidiobolus thromboides FSU 785]